MPFDTTNPEEHVWTLATEADEQQARVWLSRCELIVRGYALAAAAGRAEFVTCEMAATFHLDERTASGQLVEARQLLELPALIEAVQDGRLRLPHARALLDELRPLEPALAARVLDDTLPRVSDQPPANIRKITRRSILRADPAAAERRRRHATAGRSAFLRPLPDGMCDLTLNLRAETALRIHGLASAATAVEDGSGRTADARRADWIVEQILRGSARTSTGPSSTTAGSTTAGSADKTGGADETGGAAGAADAGGTGAGGSDAGDSGVAAYGGGLGGDALDGRRRRPCQALITMDVRTALGLDDEPCELAGYGPITAQHGRELLATAELRKVCLDPITGQVLHVDQTLHRPVDPVDPVDPDDADATGARDRHRSGAQRQNPTRTGQGVREVLQRMLTEPSWMPTDDEPQYRPSAGLTRTVQTRTPTCTFPSCSTGSRFCDLDHLNPWPTGPTCADNLAPASRRHHRAKQAGWAPTPAHDGGTLWHSPSDRTYRKPPGRPTPPGPRLH